MIVASQIRAINYQTVVAYIAIVGYMGVDHEQAIVADLGEVAEFIRTAVYGNTFTKDIIISNTHFAQPIVISQVLGRSAHNDIGEELIIGARNNVATNSYIVVQHASWSNANLWTYDAERADENIVGNLCGWINASKRAYF